jgi:hypothetical protein
MLTMRNKSFLLAFLPVTVGFLVLCHFMLFYFVIETKPLLWSMRMYEEQRQQQQGSSYSPPLANVWTQITFSAEYDQELMPLTIRHYLEDGGLDPNYMLIILHHQDPNAIEELEAAIQVVESFGIPRSLIQTWHGDFESQKNTDMRLNQRKLAGIDECDWILKFDSDEHLRVPGNDMVTFLEVLSQQGFDVAYGNWVDRVGFNGTIPNMTSSPTLNEQFPLGCRFTAAAADAKDFKAFAFRGYLKEKRSGHRLEKDDRPKSCPYPLRLVIDHYKWSWPVINKLQRRIKHYRDVAGIPWWTESAAFLDHIANNSGQIDVNRPDLRCENLGDESHNMAILDSHTSDVPRNEKGKVDATACGRPFKTCPSKLHRPARATTKLYMIN